jgi:hypothetical protein
VIDCDTGVGSTFTVILPLPAAERPAATFSSKRPSSI